jgi:hypothetical protein
MSTVPIVPPPPTPSVNANITVSNRASADFDLALSTSFQPAEWDNAFFFTSTTAKKTLLENLQPHHIRLQTISHGIPQTSPTTWDFSVLDDITQPVLAVGDHSPEMQLGWAPSFMWAGGELDASQFSDYAQKMVSYYNSPAGFTASDGSHVSPSGLPIRWWGILNEPSINNVSDTEYVQIYNEVVPAMKAADPTLKFVALELCCGSEYYAQTFADNVTVQVDAVATHYYSSCNQKDSDQQLFSTVPGFANSVQRIAAYLSTNPALGNVPIWITENNVNADFDAGGGISACNGTNFVTDRRGSSAFFAAWRPYVFSQTGKAGARALYHWDFDADAQFGEVDYNTGHTQLSYWVDYWLAHMFPGGNNAKLLESTNSDSAEIEVLPVLNSDGSVVIMVANHAVASPTDNNGSVLAAKVSLDVSSLGSFTSASQITLDSATDAAAGPIQQAILPASTLHLTFSGYGTTIVKLIP